MKEMIGILALSASAFALLQGAIAIVEGNGEVASRIARRVAALDAEDPRAFLRRRGLGEGSAPWIAALFQSSPVQAFDRLIVGTGLGLPTERVLVLMLALVCGLTVAANTLLRLPLTSSALVGLTVAFGLPLVVMAILQKRRRRRIAEQLPEALEMFVRSLKAGHPIPAAIRLVAVDMPAPIGAEFGLVFDGMTYGLDLRDALQRMARRVPIPELQYTISAIKIQHATGGSLAGVLSSLAQLMRERIKLQMKVGALSAEARLSGRVLAAMPIVIFTFIYIRDPHFYDGARSEPKLAAALYGAAVLVSVGIYIVQRIVNIRV